MSLSGELQRASEGANLLVEDINSIFRERQDNVEKEKNDFSIVSKKSLEPITRLRKNKKELMDAEQNDPELQFIFDKLTDIFGG